MFSIFFNFSQKTPSKNNVPNTMITKDQSESCYSSHQNCLKDKRQYQNSLMTKSKALWQPLYTLETLKSKFTLYRSINYLLMEFISKCCNERNFCAFIIGPLSQYARQDLMPCPFTGPKMFCAGPNFLS